MGLALGGVGGGDGVDDGLGLLVADLLVIVDDVAQVVAARVVRLAHAHRVVREVDIAVVAEDWPGRVRACVRLEVSMWWPGGVSVFGKGRGGGKEEQKSCLHFGILTAIVGVLEKWWRWGVRRRLSCELFDWASREVGVAGSGRRVGGGR